MALQVTDQNFEEILSSNEKVVLDFWAEWCGPCKMIAPIVDELAEEFAGKIVIGKVDVDDNNEIATKFGIRNIPTILFFHKGEIVDKHVGAAPKNTLQEKLEKL